MRANNFLVRASEYELELCSHINQFCQKKWVRSFFKTISRLGDGLFWYCLIILLPILYGSSALFASSHMLIAGAIAYLFYKLIKSSTERPRPFMLNHNIVIDGRVLDRYSFPSGHTLHAVNFTLIACHYFPELSYLLFIFTALVALSRVILGLHYPTDVIMGSIIGIAISSSSLYLIQ